MYSDEAHQTVPFDYESQSKSSLKSHISSRMTFYLSQFASAAAVNSLNIWETSQPAQYSSQVGQFGLVLIIGFC